MDWTSDGTAWATTIRVQGSPLLGRHDPQNACVQVDRRRCDVAFDDTFSGTQTSTDKQMMWVDHSPTSPHKDNIYAIWHDGAPAFVNRRLGPAGAWQTPIRVSAGDYLLRHGEQRQPDTDRRLVSISQDDGVTWSTPVKVTTSQTDETAASGDQYGDYNGLSGYAGNFFPSWTGACSPRPQRRSACSALAAPRARAVREKQVAEHLLIAGEPHDRTCVGSAGRRSPDSRSDARVAIWSRWAASRSSPAPGNYDER